MYNDTEAPKQFHKGFSEMAHFLVTSNAVPTLVIYEHQIYNNPAVNQSHVIVQAEDEEWLMLYTHA